MDNLGWKWMEWMGKGEEFGEEGVGKKAKGEVWREFSKLLADYVRDVDNKGINGTVKVTIESGIFYIVSCGTKNNMYFCNVKYFTIVN